LVVVAAFSEEAVVDNAVDVQLVKQWVAILGGGLVAENYHQAGDKPWRLKP
jgi:hypothetical protein